MDTVLRTRVCYELEKEKKKNLVPPEIGLVAILNF